MSLLSGLGLGNLFDKEAATKEIIQSTFADLSEELGTQNADDEAITPLSYKKFFLIIVPINGKFDHKYFVCKWGENGLPVKVREITLKEILGEQEDEAQ